LIPKGGGLRKIRWRAKGKGKTGGVRIIYFWWVSEDQVLMLDIYPKNKKEDLSGDELKELKKEMEEWDKRQATEVRNSLGLSQNAFARLLGVSVDTLQNWEQGRRKPAGAARVLLRIASKYPEVILEAA
jgi:DNA-binding transcriptional regulator YiaG